MATIVPIGPGTGGTHGADGTPDAGLVDGLRAGRRDAFEQLYELYRGRIFNLALRILQSPEDARDITQDVFVKVYRRLPGSRLTDLQLKPWLYRVAVNACYDHLRTRKVHHDLDAAVTDTRATPVDTFAQAELSQLVEDTLGDLSERHRTVLVLKDIHGLRHDEIAGILGISRGATETLLFRARESFRSHYVELTTELPTPACTFAQDAAVTAVGGGMSGAERSRVMAHAAHCPACRQTVGAWGATAVGLGLFVHTVPVPAALQGGFPFAAAGAGGAAGAGAAGGAGAGAGTATGAGTGGTVAGASGGTAAATTAGAVAGGAGVTAGSSTGLSLAAGGLLTKISGAAAVKVAALVVAATCTAGGGVAAYEAGVLPGTHRGPATPAAAGTAHDGGKSEKASKTTPPGLTIAATRGGNGAARGAAARGKDKSNDRGKGKSVAATDQAAKVTAAKGKANGNGAAAHGKPVKADKPVEAAKPARPAKSPEPDKPAKPAKPPKPPKPDSADKTDVRPE